MIARIRAKKKVAKNTWLFEFALPKKVAYEAGQSFRLTVPGAGSHFFSIANVPNPKLVTTVTRLSQSPFKSELFSKRPGDRVEVSSIAGVFTLPKERNRKLVFIAGGIGITPFISLIAVGLSPRYGHTIALLYANSDEASAPFLKEFRVLAKSEKKFTMITRFTQTQPRPGKNFFKKNFSLSRNQLFYIAGPPRMVQAIFESLLSLKIAPDHIKTEEFEGY